MFAKSPLCVLDAESNTCGFRGPQLRGLSANAELALAQHDKSGVAVDMQVAVSIFMCICSPAILPFIQCLGYPLSAAKVASEHIRIDYFYVNEKRKSNLVDGSLNAAVDDNHGCSIGATREHNCAVSRPLGIGSSAKVTDLTESEAITSDAGSEQERCDRRCSADVNTLKDRPDQLSDDEKIPMLLLLLFPASLRHAIAAIPRTVRLKLISFFGVCSMIAPLALWIAPSMAVWLSILAGSFLSIFFCWALVWFGPEDHY